MPKRGRRRGGEKADNRAIGGAREAPGRAIPRAKSRATIAMLANARMQQRFHLQTHDSVQTGAFSVVRGPRGLPEPQPRATPRLPTKRGMPSSLRPVVPIPQPAPSPFHPRTCSAVGRPAPSTTGALRPAAKLEDPISCRFAQANAAMSPSINTALQIRDTLRSCDCAATVSGPTSPNPLPFTLQPANLRAEATPRSTSDAHDTSIDNIDNMTLDNYKFPADRLKRTLSNDEKTPIVLVSCGSFSPPTNLHLRMFEEATDFCEFETDYEVIGGFFSPVGDAYKKAGLASARHRINMTRIAVRESSNWINVDSWEPLHKEYMPTVKVLDHFDHELNTVMGGVETSTGERKKIHVALLAGADLIQTMSTPGLWAQEDLKRILGVYGAFILERSGTDIDDALVSLQEWKDNIRVIPQLIQNDVSSTKIRLFRKRGKSIRYYIPDKVVDYIYEHGLYASDDEKSKAADKGKNKASNTASSSAVTSS
ncbi:hypothetical protein OPT61_g10188 [Boeremia exigua]|uniref:Uncharacterized protein n=1 Tax=Boeremia exigua TaxID=749465 RepID=A0ACC2HSD6_9PLEO|nr:hypothetical protein OPT61_g10188 [Boeremia exigua]